MFVSRKLELLRLSGRPELFDRWPLALAFVKRLFQVSFCRVVVVFTIKTVVELRLLVIVKAVSVQICVLKSKLS